jgi:hypothetical protein
MHVGVSAEGTQVDPAVPTDQIPPGAWMCDMGTAHYAAKEAGSCPVCGMTLTQKAGGDGEGSGHDHGHHHH